MMERKRRLACANGTQKADIVLKNGNVLNVFTEEILKADVAICGDTIVGVGHYEGEQEIDCTGKYLVPGFIDAHMHIESCMLAPGELAKVLVKAGTTTIVADPHEIVNVSGSRGMDYFLRCVKDILVNVFFMIPSAVPATDVETNGCGEFLAADMMKYVDDARVLGLGETMRFAECCSGEKRMADKLELFSRKHIDGHAPGITGKEVQAYRLAGVENDHECSTPEEVLDKLRAGFHIYIREGSGAKNLETLVRTLLAAEVTLDQCAFCTDDKHVEEIEKEGHISTCIRKAIALGVPVAQAYKMGSYQTAQFYGLKNYGAIGAGYRADIVFLDDIKKVCPVDVMKNGRILTEEDYAKDYSVPVPEELQHTVHVKGVTGERIALACDGTADVIQMNPHQIVTTHLVEQVPVEQGFFVPNVTYNKICVVERHGKTGEIGVAPLKGFGVKNGAVATSVAHDSHNLIVAGDNDADILLAIETVQKYQGGYAIVSGGRVVDVLPLPICGLMSEESAHVVTEKLASMREEAEKLGISKDIDPFITLSFMALTVIPEIRVTERGVYLFGQ
ncbi:MAG: adenine deaminase [Roseburia sp.]